jgi:hypothetical protein
MRTLLFSAMVASVALSGIAQAQGFPDCLANPNIRPLGSLCDTDGVCCSPGLCPLDWVSGCYSTNGVSSRSCPNGDTILSTEKQCCAPYGTNVPDISLCCQTMGIYQGGTPGTCNCDYPGVQCLFQ